MGFGIGFDDVFFGPFAKEPIVHNAIFAFVGPSGSGKSTLVAEMLRRYPSRLAVIKSVTTRPKRSAEDDQNYRFITREEADALKTGGRIIQGIEYAGQFYGNDRQDVETVFSTGHHGITALVEEGVRNFRRAGYLITAIAVRPIGDYDGRTEERRRQDAERAREIFMPDLVVENRFEPGGIEAAAQAAADYVARFMKALDT
jgi:guanylate kinase